MTAPLLLTRSNDDRQPTRLVIFPALMQLVHTLRRLGAPFTSARTRWMLGFQRRLVRRWLWLML